MDADTHSSSHHLGLTIKIIIGMVLGLIAGLALYFFRNEASTFTIGVNHILEAGGRIFIALMKMLVVPIVFVSLVTGICSLANPKALGRLGIKTLSLYIMTTAIAISLGLLIATLFQVGGSEHVLINPEEITPQASPSLIDTLVNMFPSNPFAAMAKGEMLQVIIFSVLLGTAISLSGERGKRIGSFFEDANEVIMQLVMLIISLAPYGVFCLVGHLFADHGFEVFQQLLSYFLVVTLVLFLHLIISNTILIRILANLNPIPFFFKMLRAMLFAFSTSSSNVSIPITLETVEHKLGVKNSVASFVIPLGATINMDGTAIMQGVATVFIANAYGIHIGLSGYLMVVLTATLASIGTAGVPSVGLITLAMVLQQVGLPVEGIGMIIGVDRILDMIRTAVNVTGDAAVCVIVAKSEKKIDLETYKTLSD